ncbi:hypothetical protein [Pyxidicoccus trucidator]|uniref:hypothetical protein n=1 Tax=Pyxidicoccus trucidator TaxID=2709662 RepID=UPI0013DC8E5C|nr:hypothetical protein [Pyxidicoccus trucidator]
MTAKTGVWLVISTLTVAALWAAPAEAQEEDACLAEYSACMDRANAEPVDWIRDYYVDYCRDVFGACMPYIGCGDNYCNASAGETSQTCPNDCQ